MLDEAAQLETAHDRHDPAYEHRDREEHRERHEADLGPGEDHDADDRVDQAGDHAHPAAPGRAEGAPDPDPALGDQEDAGHHHDRQEALARAAEEDEPRDQRDDPED